jgi:hypothetical protein
MTGCTSAPTSLPNLDTLVYGPISEQAYQEDNGALNSWSPHTTTAAIQQSTMDFSTTTVPIYEGSNHPATERQALWGVDGTTELSMTDLYPPFQDSTHPSACPNEEASLPTCRPAIPASHHVIGASPIASSQVTPADDTHRKFWCRICDLGFVQRQGLNRHEREKHGPRNICHLCNTYEWSPARNYLFTKHLRRYHPEAVFA